jgi:predicted ATPase
MEINISNLGTIKKGKLELGKLTILGGKNNSGKTYVAYSIYGFLKSWHGYAARVSTLEKETKELMDKGVIEFELKHKPDFFKTAFDEMSKEYSKELYKTFNTNQSQFEHTTFNILPKSINLSWEKDRYKFTLSKDTFFESYFNVESKKLTITLVNNTGKPLPKFFSKLVLRVVGIVYFGQYIGEAYVITSERTGIQMFQKELDINKNQLVEKLIKMGQGEKNNSNPFDLLEEETARYSLPIRDNINQVRDASEAMKETSFLVEKNPKFNLGIERVSGVKYNFDVNGRITIGSKEGEEGFEIDLHLASSSTRSLLGLHTYIKHLAKENELLIIDEPELNLHPTNQIYLARLVAEMVNNGVRILITTHSDFFLKEINNLIALHSDFEGKDKIVKEYDYLEDELLSPEDVRAYICGEGTIREVEVDEFGLTETSFDDAMDMINEISSEIAFQKSMNPVKA